MKLKTKNRNIYVTAILPAHNEEAGIEQAIHSIRSHVDKIIVAMDANTQVLNPNAWFAKAMLLVCPNRKRLIKGLKNYHRLECFC